MRVLLDTAVLIDALRNRGEVRQQLAAMVGEGKLLATSAMNVAEVYAGMRPEEERRTEALLSSLETLPMTEAIAQRAGKMKAEQARAGRTCSLADMLIASSAMEHGMVLVTGIGRTLLWRACGFGRNLTLNFLFSSFAYRSSCARGSARLGIITCAVSQTSPQKGFLCAAVQSWRDL